MPSPTLGAWGWEVTIKTLPHLFLQLSNILHLLLVTVLESSSLSDGHCPGGQPTSRHYTSDSLGKWTHFQRSFTSAHVGFTSVH